MSECGLLLRVEAGEESFSFLSLCYKGFLAGGVSVETGSPLDLCIPCEVLGTFSSVA